VASSELSRSPVGQVASLPAGKDCRNRGRDRLPAHDSFAATFAIALAQKTTPSLSALMKAKVVVMPKKSVLDPQGVAVREAIHHHGLRGIKAVRVGKFIELDLEGTENEAQLHALCHDLLSNPVIEEYELTIENAAAELPGATRN
jgi:phosphoribosylformylglycinamidine synthase PurS subunit